MPSQKYKSTDLDGLRISVQSQEGKENIKNNMVSTKCWLNFSLVFGPFGILNCHIHQLKTLNSNGNSPPTPILEPDLAASNWFRLTAETMGKGKSFTKA